MEITKIEYPVSCDKCLAESHNMVFYNHDFSFLCDNCLKKLTLKIFEYLIENEIQEEI